MGDGTKLAIAILVMWISMVFFFFAFHPGGVKDVSNPAQMLQWLMSEFGKIAGGMTTTSADTIPTGTEQALNYPGYTSNSDVGSAQPSTGGVQLA